MDSADMDCPDDLVISTGENIQALDSIQSELDAPPIVDSQKAGDQEIACNITATGIEPVASCTSPAPEPVVSPVLDPAQLVAEQEAAVASQTRKRARKPTERQLEEERKRSFRTSQKMLRREAPTLCIKDALSRTMTMMSEATNSQTPDSNVCSVSSITAADVATRFLSKVHASRSTVIENIVRKEMSQLTSKQSAEVDEVSELVLEDENANLEVPLAREKTNHSMSVRDFDLTANDTQGKHSGGANAEDNDDEDDQLTKQLRRKHEMLRLRSSVFSQENSQPTGAIVSPLSTPLVESKVAMARPIPKPLQLHAPSLGLSMPSMASRQAGLQQRAATFLKVVSGDVQLLKRTNSFENSGSKPIVFAAAEKPKKPQSSSSNN